MSGRVAVWSVVFLTFQSVVVSCGSTPGRSQCPADLSIKDSHKEKRRKPTFDCSREPETTGEFILGAVSGTSEALRCVPAFCYTDLNAV